MLMCCGDGVFSFSEVIFSSLEPCTCMKKVGGFVGCSGGLGSAVRALLSWHGGVDEVKLAGGRVGGADRRLVKVAFFRAEE